MTRNATTARADKADPFTILIADDNRDFVEFLNLLLAHDGFSVRRAFDGAEAVRSSRDDTVDLVILDVMMPKLDGLAVCRELKKSRPSLPVILLTAKDDLSTRTEAIALGVSEFLAKPVNIEDFLTRVRTQCQIAQWDKELDDRVAPKPG